MSEYENVLVNREGKIGFMSVNRPDKRNSLNIQTRKDIKNAIDELEKDEEIRVIIITGEGEKAFIAGADIEDFEGRTAADQYEHSKLPGIYEEIENCEKPVIAMINGYALGGGCEVALACDIRIAAESAKLGQPEIRLGIIPGGGGTQRLPRLIGQGKAMQLILTGDIIDAEEAKEIGLVEELIPDEELEEKTFEIAESIADKSPLALKYAKKSIQMAERAPLDVGREFEVGKLCLAFATEDKEEGIKAFKEKRDPEFEGK